MIRLGTVAGLLCLGASLGAGCSDSDSDYEHKNLIPAHSETQTAAHALTREYPGVRIFSSQTSGEILWIDAHQSPLTRPAPVSSAAAAVSVLQSWVAAHPNAYRIQDPASALQSQTTEFDPTARTLRFEQYQKGIPVQGHYGIARFSVQGELISLVTRLLPDANFTTQASPGSVQAGRLAVQSQGGYIPAAPGSPTPDFHVSLSPRAWRLSPGSTAYRLVRPILERQGIQVIRKMQDPESGETLESWDETPSELAMPPKIWMQGQAGYFNAPDSLGKIRPIPSIQSGSVLTLGFTVPGALALGQANTIADAGTAAHRDTVPLLPLATDAADWTRESAYADHLRAATQLALHLETTQRWFLAQLARASWDGEGGNVHAAIRGNRDTDGKPQLNAWGSNGFILVGDGASPSGQFLSDALDVVAHEFTHSVIDATAGLEYHDEVGALNESIADFFGKCVQGFADPVVGHEAGAYFRDILHPSECNAPAGQPDCRQPARYGDFRVIPVAKDNGGVHVNSSIVSLALARTVLAQGVLPLAKLVQDHLTHGRMSTETNLEEFAATLSDHCLSAPPALSTPNALCAELESHFTEVELLRRI